MKRVRRSLRARIASAAMAVMVLVLVGVSLLLVREQRRSLDHRLDAELVSDLAELVDELRDEVPASGLAPGVRVDSVTGDDGWVQVVDASGRVVAASELATAPLVDAPVEHPLSFDRDDLRVRAEPLRLRGQQVTIVAAEDREPVDASIATLTRSLAVGVPIFALALLGLIWVGVGRALAPVEALRADLGDVTAETPERRVHVPPETELARLARTMNATLDRIDAANHAQRRFVADAAHELRGPLTRMRTDLEVSSADPALVGRVHDDVVGMQRLVDDLLALARPSQPVSDLVDLDEVVRSVATQARPAAVGVRDVAPAQVRGDAAALGRLVANLLDNATRHATSSVVVGLRALDGHAELAVTDDGPGVPPAHAERIFDRFARVDEARSPDAGGAGLGLAIARSIAEGHGGSLVLDTSHTAGARFVLRLPVAG